MLRIRQRCQSSEQLLEFFLRDPNDFLSRLVTMDETWLYHYDPETKQQSVERQQRGSTHPKKFRTQKSAGKVLASISWDQDDILLIDYLPKGRTINAEYCLSLLMQLKDVLKGKHHRKVTKGVLFLHANAPPHRALATLKKLAYLGFQCLDHPLYSLDLAPFCSLDWKSNWKVAILHLMRRSLLLQRPGWTGQLLNIFWVACAS